MLIKIYTFALPIAFEQECVGCKFSINHTTSK